MPDRTEATSRRESERVGALRRYGILDTPAEKVYDDVTRLAAQICGTPIALISLVDVERQWFKSAFGYDVPETSREISFCSQAIQGNELFEVADAATDRRFRDNPLVTGEPGFRFYAGAPLTTPDGYNLGTVCVIDREPRTLTPSQQSALGALAQQTMAHLELRRALLAAAQVEAELVAESERRSELEEQRCRDERFLNDSLDALPDSIAIIDRRGEIVRVNETWRQFAADNGGGRSPGLIEYGANYLEICKRATARGCPEAAEAGSVLRAILEHGRTAAHSIEYPCHSETRKRWFVVTFSPFSGDPSEYIAVSHHDITRRKQAENEVHALNRSLERRVEQRTVQLASAYESLAESERRFRSIFDNARLGVLIAGPDGRLLQVNRAFADSLREEPAQMIGHHIGELVHTADRAQFGEQIDALLRGESPGFGMELRHRSAPASGRWAHASVSAVTESTGEITHLIAVIQDITARKEAQHQRDIFFRVSLDILVIGGFDGSLYRVNPAVERVLGYTEAEVRSAADLQLVHPGDRAAVLEQMGKLRKGRTVDMLDVRMRTRAGDYRTVRWNAAPWTADGLVVAIGRDVTRLIAAGRAVKQRDALLARAEQMAGMGSWHWHKASNKVRCSPGLQIIGENCWPAELDGPGPLIDCIAAADQSKVLEAIEMTASQGRQARLSCRLELPSGTVKTVQSVIEPTRGSGGAIDGVWAACLDVTEFNTTLDLLRESERQHRALTSRLQRIREEERTEMSREIHDELGQLLTALKMDLTLLARDVAHRDPALDRDELIASLSSIGRLADSTIESLRSIARQLRPEALDSLGLIPAIEMHAEEFAARTGLRCDVSAASAPAELRAEARTALFRIVQESMTNVARHAGASNVWISLQSGEAELELTIRDDGRGIDAGQASGAGSLGLLGMRERAAMIGGEFDIVAAREGGTVVSVRVPVTAGGGADREAGEAR